MAIFCRAGLPLVTGRLYTGEEKFEETQRGQMMPLLFADLGRAALLYGIEGHDGWLGVFTRRQSSHALFKNGARVVKLKVDADGDEHGIGSRGRVLGSICFQGVVGYFIEWDVSPKVATFCSEAKLQGSRK